jgi:hypothetical protein
MDMFIDNGRINGTKYEYMPSGNLISRVTFKDGIRDGISHWYFENGVQKEISRWLNGKQFGDAFFYSSDGIIEMYNSFDYEGIARFVVKYDSNGEYSGHHGVILGQALSSTSLDSLSIGSVVEINVSVATPPGTLVDVWMASKEERNPCSRVFLNVLENQVTYRFRPTCIGKDSLQLFAEMRGLTSSTIVRDSLTTSFVVR